MSSVTEKKIMARAAFKEKRRMLDALERERLDRELCHRIISSEKYKTATTVLAYYPIKNEPDILPVVRDALRQGKRVAFPVSDRNTFSLSFHTVSSLDEMSDGAYSIPEPSQASAPLGDKDWEDAICIVPALAYDRQGYRIGYGKGFYDRFLSQFSGVSVGIAYDGTLCDILPRESTDRRVDIIITEKEEIIVSEDAK